MLISDSNILLHLNIVSSFKFLFGMPMANSNIMYKEKCIKYKQGDLDDAREINASELILEIIKSNNSLSF